MLKRVFVKSKIFFVQNTAFVQEIVLAILIFIFTFPEMQPDFSAGLDASYVWGLNFLFHNDYDTLINLIYPFGPLAFLKIPTVIGNNFLIFLVFYTILKLTFIFCAFKLGRVFSKNVILSAFAILICSYFTTIDMLFIFLCLIMNILWIKEDKIPYFIATAVLAFIALCVKTSIGVSTLAVLFVSWIIKYVETKNWKSMLIQAGVVVVVGITVGLTIFHSFGRLFRYAQGVCWLVSGYGDAMVLKVSNNKIALLLFISIFLSFPFVVKEKHPRFFFILTLMPVFAVWKHSFIREDVFHNQAIVQFIVVFWLLMFLMVEKRQIFTMISAAFCVLALYGNMSNVWLYGGRKIEYCGVNNFKECYFHHTDFVEKMKEISTKGISPDIMMDSTIQKIGSKSVDVFPWEFCYAAANSLYWQPRVTLSTPMSKKLKDASCENYNGSEAAVDFVIWHFVDNNGHWDENYDQHYFLNDEPLVVYNLLNHYQIVERNPRFALLQKARNNQLRTPVCSEPVQAAFGNWLPIPEVSVPILRAKVISKTTLWGKIKSFLWKGEYYFIDYQTSEGVRTYRYLPETADDGLWVAPFIHHPENPDSDTLQVKAIRLRNTSAKCVHANFQLQWEMIDTN